MGATQISEDEYLAACDEMAGFCLKCKEFTNYGVEPDAEDYVCECCGDRSVYGTEESLIRGFIEIR